LLQPLDVVICITIKHEIRIDRPVGSQVWQITKLMKALGLASDSLNNCAAFRRAGPVINLRIFPSVDSGNLNEMINSSTLSDTAEEGGENQSSGDEGRHSGRVDFGLLNVAYFRGE
jgi:hypothetical protein